MTGEGENYVRNNEFIIIQNGKEKLSKKKEIGTVAVLVLKCIFN